MKKYILAATVVIGLLGTIGVYVSIVGSEMEIKKRFPTLNEEKVHRAHMILIKRALMSDPRVTAAKTDGELGTIFLEIYNSLD